MLRHKLLHLQDGAGVYCRGHAVDGAVRWHQCVYSPGAPSQHVLASRRSAPHGVYVCGTAHPGRPPMCGLLVQCATDNLYSCTTSATCIAAGRGVSLGGVSSATQWVQSACCGDGCPVAIPGRDLGSCEVSQPGPREMRACLACFVWGFVQRACSPENPSSCHDELSCQSVGRQWVSVAMPDNP